MLVDAKLGRNNTWTAIYSDTSDGTVIKEMNFVRMVQTEHVSLN